MLCPQCNKTIGPTGECKTSFPCCHFAKCECGWRQMVYGGPECDKAEFYFTWDEAIVAHDAKRRELTANNS